jgi:hypothetical protein
MTIDDGYIGVTCDTSERFSRHRLDLKKGMHINIHLQRVYNKGHKPIYKILVIGGKDYIYNLEKTLRPTKNVGYNIAEGGFYPPSNKGIPMSKEQKKKISLSNMGKKNSDEHIAKIVSTRRSNGSYKTGEDNPTSKRVAQIGVDENIVAIFPSVRSVYTELGYNNNNISSVCRGEREFAYGYIWRYI